MVGITFKLLFQRVWENADKLLFVLYELKYLHITSKSNKLKSEPRVFEAAVPRWLYKVLPKRHFLTRMCERNYLAFFGKSAGSG